MSVTKLASQEDVEADMGRALTTSEAARVSAILDKASELFRIEAKREFTPGESTQRLRVFGDEVVLPDRPVIEVTSVTDDDVRAIGYTYAAPGILTLNRRVKFATVTYEHGGGVPDLVRLTIASIARQVLNTDDHARAGATGSMEVTGPFTTQRSYAVWAQGGTARLSPDDRATARRYRIMRRRPIPMARARVPYDGGI